MLKEVATIKNFLFQNYPDMDREQFSDFLFELNYGRIKTILPILLTITFLMLVISVTIHDLENIRFFNLIYFIFVVIICAYNWFNKDSEDSTPKEVVVYLTYGVSMVWSIMMFGYNGDLSISFVDYILVTLFLSILISFKWEIQILAYFLNIWILFTFTPYFQLPISYYLPNTASLVIFMIISFITSRIIYSQQLSNFIMTKELIKNQQNLEYMVQEKTYELFNKNKSISKDIIHVLTKILELYDPYTKGHSENVASMAVEIGKELNLPASKLTDLYWTGIVHDIGKIQIDKTILNKKGSLTNEEYEKIKQHPYFGYTMIKDSPSLSDIAYNVLYHHERWDGKGYPTGISADQIPLESQIIAVADSWDAMLSKRVYRDNMGTTLAFNEIIMGREKQFSPEVVDAFTEIIRGSTLMRKYNLIDAFVSDENNSLDAEVEDIDADMDYMDQSKKAH